MTNTAKNGQTHEAPLVWTAKSESGSVGRTYRAEITLAGDEWAFTVDQPYRGHWVARGWRNGAMRLYRQDRTARGAKTQAQSWVNLAAISTCDVCEHIAGHEPGCTKVRVARPSSHWDEIKSAARDVADFVCSDERDRDEMADRIIILVGLMIKATGKCVAVAGEVALNDDEDGDPSDAARYLVGDDIQDAAREVVDASVLADPAPGVPGVTKQRREGSAAPVPRLGLGDIMAETCDGNACGDCFPCRRSAQLDEEVTSPFGPVQRWGGTPEAPECNIIPGDMTPSCDFDPACLVHGVLGRSSCCHPAGTACPWSGVRVDGCCYPMNEVCPEHH